MSHTIFITVLLSAFFTSTLLAEITGQQDSTRSPQTAKDTLVKVSDTLSTTVKDSAKKQAVDSVQVIIKDTSQTAEAESSVITIPAGTILVIRFASSISTADPPESYFTGILEADLIAAGKIIASQGSPLKGKIIDSQEGSRLTFRFVSLKLENETAEIKTITAGVEGRNDKTARIIGNVSFSGGPFAGVTSGNGAPITGGLAGLKTGKNDIQIPAGIIIEIPLVEALIIK